MFDALRTSRRRCVLYQLLDITATSLDTLADDVAAMEAERLSEQIPADIRDTVKSDLHHQILPKLAVHDVIEYDPQTKTVSYQRPSPHIEELLALARDFDPVSAD